MLKCANQGTIWARGDTFIPCKYSGGDGASSGCQLLTLSSETSFDSNNIIVVNQNHYHTCQCFPIILIETKSNQRLWLLSAVISSCLALQMLRHTPDLQAAAELNDSNLSAEGNHLQNIMIVTQCRMSMQDLKIIPNQLSSALLRKHFIKLFRFNIILTFI